MSAEQIEHVTQRLNGMAKLLDRYSKAELILAILGMTCPTYSALAQSQLPDAEVVKVQDHLPPPAADVIVAYCDMLAEGPDNPDCCCDHCETHRRLRGQS